jgi:S-adenosylmethionine:tRNA-ribosyltransferase-isomerase (queuine synthetase)
MANVIKKIKKMSGKIIAVGTTATGLAIVSAGSAHAALDLSTLAVDTSDYETIATFLITALVGFWGIKKGLALLGR